MTMEMFSGDVDSSSAGDHDVDPMTLLVERDEKISSLERTRLKQDESLALLRSELGAAQIKHKEELYWLRLELKNIKRDKDTSDQRLADLFRDMREIDEMSTGDDPLVAPVCIDSSYVLHLQSQLSRSMQTMGVLDNQIGMVKKSCDEVVKSLKEEISDVMDDKCRMEVDLMTQLATLDAEKRRQEDEFDHQIQTKDEKIARLQRKVDELQVKNEELLSTQLFGGGAGGGRESPTHLHGSRLSGRGASPKHENGEGSSSSHEDLPQSQDKEGVTPTSKKDGAETEETPVVTDESTSSSEGHPDDSAPPKGENAGGSGRGNGSGPSPPAEAFSAAAVPSSEKDDEDQQSAGGDSSGDPLFAEAFSRAKSATAATASTDDDDADTVDAADLTRQIESLTKERDDLRDEYERTKDELSDVIASLEDVNAEQEERIIRLRSEVDSLRQRSKEEQAKLDAIADKEKKETLRTLERVAEIWEKADDSIQTLEETMEELRPYEDEDEIHEDRERALSTLESASLVHGQIKVSLLLVELKLRNQLSSLKNDKLNVNGVVGGGMSSADGGAAADAAVTSAIEIMEKTDEIQNEALEALQNVEESMIHQIQELEERCKGEENDVRGELQSRAETVRILQSEIEKLEQRAEDTERRNADLEGLIAELKKELEVAAAKGRDASGGGGMMDSKASYAMVKQLQEEVLSVVEKVKEKNAIINRLTASAEEHKVREAALKKELKRLMKKVRSMDASRNDASQKDSVLNRGAV